MNSGISDKNNKKFKILVVDDSEINRSILSDMLGNDFIILNACDGEEAISMINAHINTIDLILLDIVMPKMDGFEVLAMMNRYNMIESTPVIIISAENSPSYVERAYELGASDFINRPFDARIVRRRVLNTIMLYSKQRKLVDLVADQMLEKEKNNTLLINILSHIVEFRNGESGLHVLHIHVMSDILLKSLIAKTGKYNLSSSDISLIATASSLHDIGKIGIPEEILNKPGRLTPEEFAIVKKHSEIGASMLESLPIGKSEKLVKYAYEICRWHHERYDGRGYPDGLSGEEIPISAQIVALADVYDALTSKRVYKDAYSHEEALAMIMRGECGAFNPLLLDCLNDVSDKLKNELTVKSFTAVSKDEMTKTVNVMLNYEDLTVSQKTFKLLEQERTKSQFYIEMSDEIQFEFTAEPPMINISDIGVKKLGFDKVIINPLEDHKFIYSLGDENLKLLIDSVRETTVETPNFRLEVKMPFNGELHWSKIIGRVIFSETIDTETGKPKINEVIGKIVDIHNEHVTLKELQYKATHDPLTKLLNHDSAKVIIEEKLMKNPNTEYWFILFDLDFFKIINDNNGHRFGDDVLKYIAGQLISYYSSDDVISRVGGDEFLIFLEATEDLSQSITELHKILSSKFAHITISASIGVVETKTAGRDYNTLFNCADNALYDAKRRGKHCISYYNDEVEHLFSTISPIEIYQEFEDIDEINFESKTKITRYINELKTLFTHVRLVDVSQSIIYDVDDNGQFIKQKGKCHQFWNRKQRCENCISAKTINTKKQHTKFEYVNNDLYFIKTLYLEFGSTPYVLELISKVDDETVCGAFDKEQFINNILEKNHLIYTSEYNNVYNRRYYDDQVRKLSDLYVVGTIKTTNYPQVLRQYAKEDVFTAFKKVTDLLFGYLRNTDLIIHYENDCFIFVVRILTEGRYTQLVNNIEKGLEKLNNDESQPFHFVFASSRGIDSIENLVLMNEKKLSKKNYQKKVNK